MMRSSYVKKNLSIIIFSLIAVLVWWSQVARADDNGEVKSSDLQQFKTDDAEQKDQTYIEKIKGCFFGDLRVLTYGVAQQYAKSDQNPNNNFVQFPHYSANLEIRPDLRLDLNYLELSAKPRAKFDFQIWEEGERSGETKWGNYWYVNEWLVRLKAWDKIFVSYGRENLQWGPSFLFSPSNPFFSDNGRSNPYLEVPGMDFGRLVFIPHNSWTMSFIVNTDEGRNTLLGLDPFEKTYAVKIDYTGNKSYASVILSKKDDKETLGYFGGWTVADAILLYSEGSFTKGKKALYPVSDVSLLRLALQRMLPDNPEIKSVIDNYVSLLGASLERIYPEDSEIYPVLLVGGSYTFEGAGTITLEYAYNGLGYNSQETDRYYRIRGIASLAFDMGGIPGLLGQYVLLQAANSGLKFLRKNYAMLQYYQSDIKKMFDLTLRWTQNLDDSSGQFLALLSCSLGNHWELFSSGVINAGGNYTEFGTFIDYQVMFGLKFTF
jgi:hypothetical protein